MADKSIIFSAPATEREYLEQIIDLQHRLVIERGRSEVMHKNQLDQELRYVWTFICVTDENTHHGRIRLIGDDAKEVRDLLFRQKLPCTEHFTFSQYQRLMKRLLARARYGLTEPSWRHWLERNKHILEGLEDNEHIQ